MTYVLPLEAIGDDTVALERLWRGVLSDGGVDGGRVMNLATRRPWVAEVTGLCPRFGLSRDFLHGKKDYRRANSKGSRGVYIYYRLKPGRVYEVNEWRGWRDLDRHFCRVEGGNRIRMTRGEVDAWLR